jgi:hypothetical protein
LENLEGLTEKVGTLGLQTTRKRCGAAKKRMRKARVTEAPTGGSAGGQHVRYRWLATDPTGAQYFRGSTWTRR